MPVRTVCSNEFLPTDADDDFSKIVTIDQLETGKEYEVIVTNLSGFYRYRMRDAVKIAGKYKNLPILEFIGRIDQTVSIMGGEDNRSGTQDCRRGYSKAAWL